VEANGIEILLNTMNNYIENSPKIQRQACWAVLTLAGSDDISGIFMKHDGTASVVRALMKYP
jgi:hypothetical protein